MRGIPRKNAVKLCLRQPGGEFCEKLETIFLIRFEASINGLHKFVSRMTIIRINFKEVRTLRTIGICAKNTLDATPETINLLSNTFLIAVCFFYYA